MAASPVPAAFLVLHLRPPHAFSRHARFSACASVLNISRKTCERITDLETSLAIVIKLLEERTAAANLLCRVAAGVRFAFKYIVSPIALIVLAAYLLTGADVPDWFLRLERVFTGSGPRPRAVYVDLTRSDVI